MKETKQPVQTKSRLEEIRLRKEELELKIMERTVRDMTAADGAMRMTAEQQERNMLAEAARVAQTQALCDHKKGGSNLDGFAHGSGEHYSVIKHIYPMPYLPDFPHCTGTVIACQRCHKEVNEGDPLFAEWVRFPTNNQPSGNPLFTVTYTDPRPRADA